MTRAISTLAGPRLVGEPSRAGDAAGAAHSPVPAADFSPQARTHEPHATAEQIVRMDLMAECHRVLLGRVIRDVYGCAPWDLHEDEAERLCDPGHFALMVAEWEGRNEATAGTFEARAAELVAKIDALQGRIRQLEATLRELERDAESLDWHYSPVAQEMGRVMRRRVEEVLSCE
jgi:hypothetical protein